MFMLCVKKNHKFLILGIKKMIPRFVSQYSILIQLLNPPPLPTNSENVVFDTILWDWIQLQPFIRPSSPTSIIESKVFL